jgi:glyoxylase-like metal-dependent hydrolase (beta-lactamase superfamily II)
MDPGVHLISEPGHVNSFLIQGTKSALLFDTGLGVANIRKVAEELSELPLLIVNSHYHFDHTGGNRLFHDEEGDVLDLGGRQLHVMHTPGHSPDCICLFDQENGLLFGGDTINTGPIYAQLEDSNVEQFARSTARLAEMVDAVQRVFVCHFLRVENQPALLSEIAEGFQKLLQGDVFFRENVDCLNYPVREACFDHFSIFIPAGEPTRIV